MSHPIESMPTKFRSWIKHSLYVKIASICFIIILLMIPNSIVMDLIVERNFRQQEVINEVSAKWGGPQEIVGPVLTVPYKTFYQNKEGKTFESVKHAHFLPNQISIDGTISPELRKRGIYDVVLYQALIQTEGNFKQPDFKRFGIESEHIMYDKAFIQISIPDMTGINEEIKLNFNDRDYLMEPGIEKMNGFLSGIKIPVVIDNQQEEMDFAFELNLNGSQALTFGPVGKETVVNLKSVWASPSFMGSFLPDDHDISEDGFTANWKVLDLNRNYPQAWIGEGQNLNQSLFGLELIQPVDEYTKNLRSAKYALLVISLTFLVFFFFEIINKQKVHPVHYTLIGLAITIFYFLLLSISEHFGFNNAYLISSIVTIVLIGTYSRSILETRILSLVLSTILTSVLGFIFIILQLEDFALLAGSTGLFVVLACVMYYSRNINWSGFRKSSELN